MSAHQISGYVAPQAASLVVLVFDNHHPVPPETSPPPGVSILGANLLARQEVRIAIRTDLVVAGFGVGRDGGRAGEAMKPALRSLDRSVAYIAPRRRRARRQDADAYD